MKRRIRDLVRSLGYDLVRYRPQATGRDPFQDMASLLDTETPLIFDVGANVGQTITSFRSRFPRSVIHSFEPSPSTFAILREHAAGMADVHLWNCGLGSVPGRKTFLENSYSTMSSFLPPSAQAAGEVTRKTPVEVDTIDRFRDVQKIGAIDILKIDTQGFELEVLKGAERTLRENRIRLIYLEVIFSEMYHDLPPFGRLYDFLSEQGWLLVSFYKLHYQDGLASWTDALFVHRSAAGKGRSHNCVAPR